MIVTLILAEINLMNDANMQSPNTNSGNMLSVWMLVCILFVVTALLHYGCILFYKHRISMNPKANLTRVDSIGLVISMISLLLFNLIFWNTAFQ